MADDWNTYNRVQITPRQEGAVLVSPRYHVPEGSVIVSPRLAGPEPPRLAAPEGSVIVSPRLEGSPAGPLLVAQISDTATIGGLPLEATRRGESSFAALDCCGGWFRTFGVAFVAFCAGFALCIIIDRTVLSTGGGFSTPSFSIGSTGSSSTAGMAQDEMAQDIPPNGMMPAEVGCYPAIEEVDGDDSIFDWTCADNPDKAYCRMGLPFFRVPMSAGMSMVDCVSFCLSKMMDLSGISTTSKGTNVCRCGASENNKLVWGEYPAPANLLPPTHLNNQDGCSMMMFKTPETDQFDSIIERNIIQISEDEGLYIAGVRTGRRPDDLSEQEEHVTATPIPQPVGPGAQDGGHRWCYPHACADGGPWTTKKSDGTVVINYYFSGLGSTAQAVFRQAVAAYERTTCLRFQQSTAKPTVKVDSSNPNSCSATVGFPGDWGEGHLNMGWCNSMVAKGNVIHELGHIIGRTHTQRRPDATQSYAGQGPFLRINWANVPSSWRSQYTGTANAYTGSNEQSALDPFHGNMRYDYLSIMSYGPGGTGSKARMVAIDPTYQNEMGQRDGLTDLDILAIKDMYQCGTAGAVLSARSCLGALLAALAAVLALQG